MFSQQAKTALRRDTFVFTVAVVLVFVLLTARNALQQDMDLNAAMLDALQLTAIFAMVPAAIVLIRFYRRQSRD